MRRAHILFVTPDKKDGYVYDKVYEFNAEDEQALVSLMQAVYKLVLSLKFIDDPEIFIAPDKTKGIRDIKQFISGITE